MFYHCERRREARKRWRTVTFKNLGGDQRDHMILIFHVNNNVKNTSHGGVRRPHISYTRQNIFNPALIEIIFNLSSPFVPMQHRVPILGLHRMQFINAITIYFALKCYIGLRCVHNVFSLEYWSGSPVCVLTYIRNTTQSLQVFAKPAVIYDKIQYILASSLGNSDFLLFMYRVHKLMNNSVSSHLPVK